MMTKEELFKKLHKVHGNNVIPGLYCRTTIIKIFCVDCPYNKRMGKCFTELKKDYITYTKLNAWNNLKC